MSPKRILKTPDLPQANEDKPSENKALQAEIDQGGIQLIHADCFLDGNFIELDDLGDDKGGSSICGAFLEGESKKPDLPETNEKKKTMENDKIQEEIERLKVLPYRGDYLLPADYFSDGDFLEMDDLQTSSSSSGNSTPSLDVYFNPGALLKQLETDLSSNQYNLSRPNDRVLTVVPEGSPTGGADVQVAEAALAVESKQPEKMPTPEETTPPPPPVQDEGASTSRQMSRGRNGNRPHRGKTFMRFLCFMGF